MTDKEKQRELIVEIMKGDENSGLYDNTNMKNTAVEMFATKVMNLNITPKEMNQLVEWFSEAKDLERYQISMAHLEGAMKMHHKEYKSGDQYYTETYEQ